MDVSKCDSCMNAIRVDTEYGFRLICKLSSDGENSCILNRYNMYVENNPRMAETAGSKRQSKTNALLTELEYFPNSEIARIFATEIPEKLLMRIIAKMQRKRSTERD